ncbi:MBL fold metallo-hydrolase [Paraflavitalea soli]|uniref:MBL fold metallo-hydrolase n=1 Tax=Paraflavitalea soli TaxID=2315862 RepID=A0A3B7MV54_9BACT|nr:MBL fold metallo-hydrolase [Paraflavitalea soli]AXY75515.1 MBL fold metallo-hydrolase [Paraflavitalea soli]
MKVILPALLFIFVLSSVSAQSVSADTEKTKTGPLVIQPVKHASLLLTTKGTTIYVDPSGADNFKGMAEPGIILITDIHGDHFDPKTIAAIRTAHTLIIAPQVVADKLTDIDKDHLVVLKNGDKTTQAGITIEAIPMYNLPESDKAMHTKGRGNGYVLNIGGKRIYISGDTQGIPEMRSLKDIDIAFVCMNLPYTMDVKEAADAVLAFQPKIVYPYHYRGQGGLSDVKGFESLVNGGNKKIEVRLRNWYPAQ